jgi:ferritin-like metal-binding protein YciE
MLHAEKRFHAALPKLANAARADHLRTAFKDREAATQQQIARVKAILALIR